MGVPPLAGYSIRKQAEKPWRERQYSVFLHGFCLSACLQVSTLVSTLTSLQDGL